MNNILRMNAVPLLTACIAAGVSLSAQVTTGTLVGTVKDNKGRVVPGATVVISSPALMSTKTLKSDDRGDWRLALLPPGDYKVTFSKEGYIGSGLQGIRVGIGAIARADAPIRSQETATEVVEVVATNATVDKTESKVGTNYSADQLNNLPVTRNFEGAAYLTPGAVSSANNEISLRGGTTNSTLYRLNGVDMKNDLQGTRTGTGVLPDMIEDISVDVSPLHPRNGRTSGGAMNVVTKSGSNTWSGSMRANLERDSWYAKKPGLTANALAQDFSDDLVKTLDVVLLGPVVKDKLWFSLATRFTPDASSTEQIPRWGERSSYSGPTRIMGNPSSALDQKLVAGPAGYQFTYFDENAYYTRKETNKYYEGKLTWSVVQDHTLEFAFVMERNKLQNRDQYSGGFYAMKSMLGEQITNRDTRGLVYRGILGSSTFLEASYNSYATEIQWPHVVHPTIGDPIIAAIGRTDGKTGVPPASSNGTTNTALATFTSPAASTGTEIRGSKSWRVNLKQYWNAAGTHDTDFGVESYTGRHRTTSVQGPNNRRFFVGGSFYNASANTYQWPAVVWEGPGKNGQNTSSTASINGVYGPAPVYRQYYGQDGEANPISTGLYAGDMWTINEHWLMLLGFRLDKYKINDSDGAELLNSQQFSPRFQIKWDPKGDSSHLLSLSWARFADDFFTGFTRAFTKTGSSTYSTVGWTGATFNQPKVGTGTNLDALQWIGYSDLTNMANWKNAAGSYNTYEVVTAATNVVDKNMKPSVADELSFNYTRQFPKGSLVSMNATHRAWKQQWAVRSEYAPENWLLLADPLGSSKAVYAQKNYINNSNDLKREYVSFDIRIKNVLSRTWTLETVLAYSTLKGNDQGGDSASSSFRDNNVNPLFSNPDIMLRALPDAAQLGRANWTVNDFAPYGYLSSHQLFKGRLMLTGNFPLDKGGFLSYSFMGDYNTGSPVTPTATAPIGKYDVAAPANTTATKPVAPSTFARYYLNRGAWSNNDFFSIDFKFAWQVPLGISRLKLIGDLFVNNVLNTQRLKDLNRSFYNPNTGGYFLLANTPATFGTTLVGTSSEETYYERARYARFSVGLKF